MGHGHHHDSDSDSDSDTSFKGPFPSWWGNPIQMDGPGAPHFPALGDSSDSDSDVDNSRALVPWVPPKLKSPRKKKHSLLVHPEPYGHVDFPNSTVSRPATMRTMPRLPPMKTITNDASGHGATRPSDWRPDYSPRRCSGLMRGLSRVRTAISGWFSLT
jgi:hypothetical protein